MNVGTNDRPNIPATPGREIGCQDDSTVPVCAPPLSREERENFSLSGGV